MVGGALVMARIAPIYGKLNLAAELPVHFQVFLLGGAGAAAFKHESVNLCASPGDGPCAPGDYADVPEPQSFNQSVDYFVVRDGSVGRRAYGRRNQSELRAVYYPVLGQER